MKWVIRVFASEFLGWKDTPGICQDDVPPWPVNNVRSYVQVRLYGVENLPRNCYLLGKYGIQFFQDMFYDVFILTLLHPDCSVRLHILGTHDHSRTRIYQCERTTAYRATLHPRCCFHDHIQPNIRCQEKAVDIYHLAVLHLNVWAYRPAVNSSSPFARSDLRLPLAFLFTIPAGVSHPIMGLLSRFGNNLAPSWKRAVGMALIISVGNLGSAVGSNIF